MTTMTLKVLRDANRLRLPQFKNRKGEPAHTKPDGSDWSLNDWYTAVMGEAGELGSILKQVRRGDITLDDARDEIAKECADIVTYLDILADQCEIALDLAVINKFNEVSKRVGCKVFIEPTNTDAYRAIDYNSAPDTT